MTDGFIGGVRSGGPGGDGGEVWVWQHYVLGQQKSHQRVAQLNLSRWVREVLEQLLLES